MTKRNFKGLKEPNHADRSLSLFPRKLDNKKETRKRATCKDRVFFFMYPQSRALFFCVFIRNPL